LKSELNDGVKAFLSERGEFRVVLELDHLRDYNQFVSFNFPTRLNSSRLFVTSVNPLARAWLAMSMSCGPIGMPLCSRSALAVVAIRLPVEGKNRQHRQNLVELRAEPGRTHFVRAAAQLAHDDDARAGPVFTNARDAARDRTLRIAVEVGNDVRRKAAGQVGSMLARSGRA